MDGPQWSQYKPPRSALTADSTESTHTSIRKLSAILSGHRTHGEGRDSLSFVSAWVHSPLSIDFYCGKSYLSILLFIDPWDLISRSEGLWSQFMLFGWVTVVLSGHARRCLDGWFYMNTGVTARAEYAETENMHNPVEIPAIAKENRKTENRNMFVRMHLVKRIILFDIL